MSDDPTAHRWDVFLAHAAKDVAKAEALYEHLVAHCRVFLDSRCLLLGDDWDADIAEAQRRSLITVVLVSPRTAAAYYQREEIAAAIALARENREKHRVVPIYLDGSAAKTDAPYGLRLKHGITLDADCSIAGAAEKLLLLHRSLTEGAEGWLATGQAPAMTAKPAPHGFSARRLPAFSWKGASLLAIIVVALVLALARLGIGTDKRAAGTETVVVRNRYVNEVKFELDGRPYTLQSQDDWAINASPDGNRLELFSCGWEAQRTTPGQATGCRWIEYTVSAGEKWEIEEIDPAPRIVLKQRP